MKKDQAPCTHCGALNDVVYESTDWDIEVFKLGDHLEIAFFRCWKCQGAEYHQRKKNLYE